MKWYKRDPDAALSGMRGMTLEERGAYNVILDLLYSRDGNVPDDERFLCSHLDCDPRVWRRLRARLIELGKLQTTGQLLTNIRATSEISTAQDRMNVGRKLRQIQLEKQCRHAGVAARTTTTTTTAREERKRARKCALPPEWRPDLGVGEEREWEKFKSYHLSKGSLFSSWEQAWRNWKLKAIDYGTLKEPQPPSATILPIKGYHARDGTPEMAAWDEYWRKTKGVNAPRSRRLDGAIFDTRWPPGYDPPGESLEVAAGSGGASDKN